MWFYMFLLFLVRLIGKLFFNIKVKGLENIPKNGRVLLCPNHISNFDPPFVAAYVKRYTYFMAKEEIFKNKFLAIIFNWVGAFPVKRGFKDTKAFKMSLSVLENNQVLCIFPEGTRSKDGKLGKGHQGAAVFALKTSSPVIPVAISGKFKLFNTLTIEYGKPIYLVPKEANKITSEDSVNGINIIMSEIENLLNKNRQ